MRQKSKTTNKRPQASSPSARARMVNQRRRDTRPELAIRSLLHRDGFRFRVDTPMPGTRRRVDICFPSRKLAVFVDGCFWHGCPEHGTAPKENADWWRAKLDANVARDRDTDSRLRASGWMVIRVWEHDEPGAAARRVAAALSQCENP